MAYHLLPTKTYFDQASADERQIVQFKGAQAYAKETAAYGTSVDSWGEMSSFIQASENGRTKPAEKDLKKAGIGNANLLTYAEEFHNEVSSWTPPAGVDVHQIAGWGMETFIGVELREFSLPWFGTVQEDYLPVFARNGDEVVPSKSGSSMPTAANIRTYWIDLDQVGDRTSIDYSHENLLEIDSALELISDVLAQEEAIALPNNTYNAEPSLNEMDSRSVFRFYLHSPLTLEVIDSEGNRIGMNGDGTIDAEIEGGEYDTFGEVHYITVPTGKHYTVLLDGYDDGFFSLDVQEIVGDRVIQDATFAGLPSTPQTTAQLEILGTIDNSTALSVDIDGDGNEDAYLVAQINEDVVYTPDEVEEKENTDTDSRESSGSKSRNTTGTEVDEGSMPAQAGMIEIELPGIEKKILLTKENHGEVLGALDDASKVEGEDRIIHEPTPKNWATSLVSWVYTLIMSVFAKISSLLTFTYAN
jgi:hypothetical protein